jgi:pimeloyl-[acyl-carrier protein] methyl ester esterase
MGLHVESNGTGPDLVLLHGWGMNARVWDEVAAELAQRFRVHNVDLPGHGGSGACLPYTLDVITAALAAALPPRAMVCGWSLGGQVALHWAFTTPAQVARLVLIASTPRFVRGPDWDCGMAVAAFDGFAQGLAADPEATLQRFILLQAQGDTAARAVARRLRELALAHGVPDAASLAAGLRILKETDLRADLPHIRQPALILHGACDCVVPPAAGAALQRGLPHSTLEVIMGAAHAPFIARPRSVARRIAEFCRE